MMVKYMTEDTKYGVKPGDILVFKATSEAGRFGSGFGERAIFLGQILGQKLVSKIPFVKKNQGKSDSIHAAIVTEIKDGEPWIAQYNQSSIKKDGQLIPPGYQQIKLSEYMAKKNKDRSTIEGQEKSHAIKIYSPSEDKAAAIAKEAQETKYQGGKYSKPAAAVSVLTPRIAYQSVPEQKGTISAYCSKFAMMVLKKCGVNIKGSINSSPRALEAGLEEATTKGDFSRKVYLPASQLQYLASTLKKEVGRLGEASAKSIKCSDKQKAIETKITALNGAIQKIQDIINKPISYDSKEVQDIANALKPSLEIHRGSNLTGGETTSLKNVRRAFNRKGISM